MATIMKKQTGDIEIDCLNFDRPKLIQHKKSIRLINCRWRGCGSWKIKRRRIRRGRWRIRRKKDYGYAEEEIYIYSGWRIGMRREKRSRRRRSSDNNGKYPGLEHLIGSRLFQDDWYHNHRWKKGKKDEMLPVIWLLCDDP